MEIINKKNFIDDIFDGDYTRINGYGDIEVEKDLARTQNKEIIVLAIGKAKKEIKAEKTAITLGSVITGILAIPEIMAIIKLIENKPAGLPNNGNIINGVFIAILCGFVVNRILELIGLSRFKSLAIKYLEQKHPYIALLLDEPQKCFRKTKT